MQSTKSLIECTYLYNDFLSTPEYAKKSALAIGSFSFQRLDIIGQFSVISYFLPLGGHSCQDLYIV